LSLQSNGVICILSGLYKLSTIDFEIENFFAFKISHKYWEEDTTANPRKTNAILFILKGKIEIEQDGKKFTAKKNEMVFMPYNARYKMKVFEGCENYSLWFNAKILSDENDLKIYHITDGYNPESVRKLFENSCEGYSRVPKDFLKMKIGLYKILSVLSGTEVPEEYALLKNAIDFIKEHYRENLPIKIYADKCNLSESYFRKKFKEFFGKTPIEYRNELRFDEAKQLYLNRYSTEQIAEILGFCDVSYMLKLYKKSTGRSLKEDAKIIL